MHRDSFTRIPPNRENILSLFHEVQRNDADHNHIAPEAVRQVAEYLGLSIAEVYGVLTFYHMFSHTPRGRYVIRLCDSLSCRVAGSLDIYSYLTGEVGLKRGETTDDGLFSLEIVNCLGSCDTAPNMMVNDRLFTNLTVDMVERYIRTLREEVHT